MGRVREAQGDLERGKVAADENANGPSHQSIRRYTDQSDPNPTPTHSITRSRETIPFD